ncbi:MAG: hypothetical protein ACRDVD_00570 [Acidimicrobiia bacterium]
MPPTPLVDELIAEIEHDPTSIFWGWVTTETSWG